MKTKKSTVAILLSLCIIVWGIIAWKVYRNLTDIPVTAPRTSRPVPVKKDSIHLLLNYRDPFLDDYIEEESPTPENAQEATSDGTENNRAKREEITPDFQYKGVIRMGKISQAIVVNNGETVLLKVREKVGEFMVTGMTEECLTVSRKGKKYQLNIE